jgi:hypothetical protein
MEENMLNDELSRLSGSEDQRICKITMNKVFKIQEGIYVMRVPETLLYMIGDHIVRIYI